MEKRKIIKKAWRSNDTLCYGETRSKARGEAARKVEYGTFKQALNYYSVMKRDKDFDLIENVLHPRAGEISEKQKRLMVHALGEKRDGTGITNHRNFYASSVHEDWEKLVDAGFATKRPDPFNANSVCYHVSPLGIAVIESMFPIFRFALSATNELIHP